VQVHGQDFFFLFFSPYLNSSESWKQGLLYWRSLDI